MKIIRVLALSTLLGASLTTVGYSNNSNNHASAIGMNTNEVIDMNSSIPFVDLFKLSAPFSDKENNPWLTKGNIAYDQFGWPKRLNGGTAGTRFLRDLPVGTIPNGHYSVLYDGVGKMEYRGGVKLIQRLPGKDIISIHPDKKGRITANLKITESNPNNYLRNIRILPPGGICSGNPYKRVSSDRQCGSRQFLSFEDHHERILFNPDYLNFMKDFKVIRFMNMSGITRNEYLQHWSQRPNMMQASWGGQEGVRGVPLEVMVELANQLDADPWFTLPHKADDAFVQNYARFVRDNLKPHLKAYIEYSNETWNGIFSQAHYMKRKGMAMGFDRNKDQAGYKYYAHRSVEIFKIWEQVFGNTQRLVRVLSGLTTNKRITQTMLNFKNAHQYTDAFAVAPYFYMPQERMRQIRDVNTVFRELNSTKNPYSIPRVLKIVKEQADLVKTYGLDLIAYEGGQHLVAYKTNTVRQGPNPSLIRANKDKRMQRIYYNFLQGWKEAGGKTFVAFSAPRIYTWHGSWGVKEHINQPNSQAPKYVGLMSFAKRQPCWWQNCRGIPAQSPTIANFANNKPQLAKVDPLESIPIEKQRVNYSIAPSHPISKPAVTSPKDKLNEMKHLVQEAVYQPKTTGYSIKRAKNRHQVFSNHWPFKLRKVISGDIQGEKDLGAVWQASWDHQYLHIKIEVQDDQLVKDSYAPWSDDSIELFIDADGSQLSTYDKRNDFQLMFRLNDQSIGVGSNSARQNFSGIKKNMFKTNSGYVLETGIPWALLGVRPGLGHQLGIDIHINDDDNGQNRDGKLSWNSKADEAWRNPSLFGHFTLIN